MLQAAVEATDQNNHECQMILDEVATKAPFIRDILKEARHFEDEDLNRSMALNLQLAVDAVQEATMAVYKWLAKPSYRRIGAALFFQPALKNGKERLYARLAAITAHQIHRIDRRSEQMSQLAGRYDEISRISEGLLSGTRLQVSRERTITVARAQLKQASKQGQELRHKGQVRSAVWSPDGTMLATSLFDDYTIWDATTGERLRVLDGNGRTIDSVAWNPDGTRVATAGPCCGIWSVATGQLLKELNAETEAVVWSPDGTRVATVSELYDTVAIWEASVGEQLTVLKGHRHNSNSLAWSPDGSRVATASNETSAIWDACTGECVCALEGHTEQVNFIAWSPNGSQVATASKIHTGAVWDASTGERVWALKGHIFGVSYIAWTPNGTRLATASWDDMGAIWEASTGQRLKVLEGHTERVIRTVWSPDGTKLATASDDGTGAVWDAATGQRLRELKGHKSIVTSDPFNGAPTGGAWRRHQGT